MFKIAGINSFNNLSTGTIMVHSLEYASRNGFECKSFYGRSKNSQNNSVFIGESKVLNKFIDFNVALIGKPGHLHVGATKRLIRYLDEFQPDLVHFQNLHGNYLNFPLILSYLLDRKIPTVATLHDCWDFTGHCAHYPNCCSRWQKGCGGCPDLHRYSRSLFFDNTFALLREKQSLFSALGTTFISPSKWMMSQFKKSVLSSNPLVLIPNGIDLTVFKNSPRIIGNKISLLGVAHPWSNEKGLDIFNRLADTLDLTRFEVKLVGVDSTLRGRLNPKIVAIGLVPTKTEIAQIYSSSDIFLNPTKFDTFPTVNLEAMASGIPVFAFDSGGAAEVITPETGKVFTAGDFDGMFSAIENYSRNSFSRNRIIEEASKYSEEIQLQHYLDLYRSLILRNH